MAVHKDNLTEFLLDLSTDPDRVERFAASPKKEAARARLSNEERIAVFSGDATAIRMRLEADDNGQGIMTHEEPAAVPAPVKKKRKKNGNGTGIMKKKKKKRPAPKKKKKKATRKRAGTKK